MYSLLVQVTELDAHAVKQQEHVYAAEFQIQQMERKIGRAKGEVSDEEKVKLQVRVSTGWLDETCVGEAAGWCGGGGVHLLSVNVTVPFSTHPCHHNIMCCWCCRPR